MKILFLAISVVYLQLTWGKRQMIQINPQKVQLSLYYDSLCPYSKKFIKNQLYPVMTSPLGRFIKLELVPYGTAFTTDTSSGKTFKCLHGVKECYLDKVHACALKMLKKDESLKFIHCMANQRYYKEKQEETCARDLGFNFSPIYDCAHGRSGTEYLDTLGMKTDRLKPALTQVPWVVINEAYTSQKMSAALKDLKATICKELGQNVCAALESPNHVVSKMVN